MSLIVRFKTLEVYSNGLELEVAINDWLNVSQIIKVRGSNELACSSGSLVVTVNLSA